MDTQKFDAITRLAANAPDRRNMLKLVGAAAVASVAGAALRSDEAEAQGLINLVVIFSRSFNDFIDIEVKNNNIAVQVCAVVEVLSADLLEGDLTCTVDQRQ